MLIGGYGKTKQEEGQRCYAKLANGDLVFLLNPDLTKKVLGEYRSRNVFSSLDSAQVDRISFEYAQNPFVLEKTDNTWHVSGKPAMTIKADKVSETLDTLSRLKVERYVVATRLAFNLYALQPP